MTTITTTYTAPGSGTWLCPDGVRSGEAAAIIMLSGHELGILPMQALRMIYVVNGRPSLAADLMKALIAREGAGYIEVVEETDDHITQRAVRTDGRGAREPQVFTWSQADTDKAQLAGSSMNKNYPRVHKEHRSTAVLARRVFPDIIGGLLCTEEAEELPAPRVIEAHFENAPDTTEPPAPPEPEKPTTLGTEGVAEFNRSMQEAADECVRAGVLAEADEAGLLLPYGHVHDADAEDLDQVLPHHLAEPVHRFAGIKLARGDGVAEEDAREALRQHDLAARRAQRNRRVFAGTAAAGQYIPAGNAPTR